MLKPKIQDLDISSDVQYETGKDDLDFGTSIFCNVPRYFMITRLHDYDTSQIERSLEHQTYREVEGGASEN